MDFAHASPTTTGGAENTGDVLADYAGVGIWVVLGLAVLIRLLQIVLRRESWASKGEDARTRVADPLVRAAAVQSSIYGWAPSDPRSLPSPPAQTTTSERDTAKPPTVEGEQLL